MQTIKWKSLLSTSGLSVLALAATSVAHSQWHTYKLYEIPGFNNKANGALCVNSYNEASGFGDYANGTQFFTGMVSGINTAPSYHTLPSGWPSLQFKSINDSNQTVGQAYIGYIPYAISYQPNGPLVDMTADLKNIGESDALGINHSGTAVGFYNQDATGGLVFHMFRWDDATQKRTGDWVNYLPGGINEAGLMEAANLKPTNYFQLQELALVPASGPTTIVTAPGDYLYIYPGGVSTMGGITAIGEADTNAENSSNSHFEGFVYNKAINSWTVLHGPGGVFMETHALGVDYWGTRIAGYTVDANGIQTATVWQNVGGQWTPTELSDLIPADPNWKYEQATSINSLGAISGFGLHLEGGKWIQRAFVAVPTNMWNLVLNEGGIYGGLITNTSVALDGLDPFPIKFGLASPEGGIHIPRQVVMPAMSKSAPFVLDSDGVDRNETATIVTSLGGAENTKTFIIHPAILSTLTITSNSDGVTGHLTLRGKAGPSGATVKLTSSVVGVTVPTTLKIAPQTSTGAFRIVVAKSVRKGTHVMITASLGDGSVDQKFTVE